MTINELIAGLNQFGMFRNKPGEKRFIAIKLEDGSARFLNRVAAVDETGMHKKDVKGNNIYVWTIGGVMNDQAPIPTEENPGQQALPLEYHN